MYFAFLQNSNKGQKIMLKSGAGLYDETPLGGLLSIGSSESNDIIIKDSGIYATQMVLNIDVDNGKIKVASVYRKNSYLNGRELPFQKFVKAKDGDEISFSDVYKFKLKIVDAEKILNAD